MSKTKKVLISLGVLAVVGIGIGISAEEAETEAGGSHGDTSSEVRDAERTPKNGSKAKGSKVEKAKVEQAPEPEPEPKLTRSQENAIRAAEDYLNYSAFSRQGLIDQLIYEDYSKQDATFAVNNVEVNWKEQAAQAAEDYLGYSSFSRQGLIDQLKYEGYTQEQAVYGVNQTGL